MNSLHVNKKNKNQNNKGFYIAVGVCLIAIGVAAWATYDSVVKFTKPKEPSPQVSSAVTTTEQHGKETNGKVEKTPESSKAEVSSTASSKPAEKKTIKTDAKVASKADEPKKEPTVEFPAGKKVVKEFSGETPVYSKTMKDWRAHTGVDFAAKKGDKIKAATNGKIKKIYADPMLGNVIIIDSGEYEIYYCGMGDAPVVKNGQSVNAGDEIGTLGKIPCEAAEEAHFHFAVKKGGEWIDPMTILPKGAAKETKAKSAHK